MSGVSSSNIYRLNCCTCTNVPGLSSGTCTNGDRSRISCGSKVQATCTSVDGGCASDTGRTITHNDGVSSVTCEHVDCLNSSTCTNAPCASGSRVTDCQSTGTSVKSERCRTVGRTNAEDIRSRSCTNVDCRDTTGREGTSDVDCLSTTRGSTSNRTVSNVDHASGNNAATDPQATGCQTLTNRHVTCRGIREQLVWRASCRS